MITFWHTPAFLWSQDKKERESVTNLRFTVVWLCKNSEDWQREILRKYKKSMSRLQIVYARQSRWFRYIITKTHCFALFLAMWVEWTKAYHTQPNRIWTSVQKYKDWRFLGKEWFLRWLTDQIKECILMETSVVAYGCQFGSFDNIGVFRVNGVVKIDITKYESKRSM